MSDMSQLLESTTLFKCPTNHMSDMSHSNKSSHIDE